MAIVFGSPLENDADAFGPGANYEGDGVDNNFSGLAASASSAAPLVTTAFPFLTNNGASGSVGGGDVASMSSARRRNNTSSSTGTGRHTSSGRAGGASGRTDHHRRRRHHHGSSSGLLADVHDDEESTGSSSNSSSSSDTHEFGDSRSSSTGPDEYGEHGVEHQTTISGSSYYNPAAVAAASLRSGPQHHHSSSAATGTTVAHVHHVGSMEDQQQRTTTLGLLQPTLSVVADDFDDGQLATTSSFASRASQMQQAGGGPLPPAGLQPQRTTSSQGLLGVVGITGSPHAYHQGGGGSGESGAGMSHIRRTSSNSSMLHSPPPSLQALAASPSGALQPARSHRSSLLMSRSDDFAVRSPPVAPIGASAHNNVAGAAAAATGSGVFHNGPLVSVEDYTTTTTDSSTRASVRLTAAGAASTWEEELQLTRNQPQQHSVDELIARTLREEAVMDEDDDMTTGGRGQVPNSSGGNGQLHRSPSGRRQQQQQQYHHGGAGLTLHASSGSFGASAPASNTSVQLAPPTRIPSAHSNTGGWGLMGSSATSGGGSFLESNPAGHSTLITEDHAIQPLTNSAHSAHHHHHQQQQQPLANSTLVSSLASESAPSPALLHLPQMQHHQNHSTTSGNDAASSSMLPSSGQMVGTFHASTTTSLASPSHDSSPRMFLQGSSMPPSHGGTSLQTQRGRGLLDDPEVHMGGSSAMTPSSFGGGGPYGGEWGSTQTNPRSPTPTSNSQSSSPRLRHEQEHHRNSSALIDTSRPLPITTRKDENHPLSEGSTTDEEMRGAPQQQQHIAPRPPLLCLPQESILVIFSYLGTSSLLLRGTCAYLNEYFLHVALDRLKSVLQPSPFSWAMLRSTNEVQRTDRIRRVQRTLSHHRKLARTMKERIFGRKHHTQLPQPQLAASGSRMGLPSAVFDPWQLQQTAGGTTHLNAPHIHRSGISDISSTALLSSAMQPLPGGGGVHPSPFATLMNAGVGGHHQQRSASPPSMTMLPPNDEHQQHQHQHHHPVSRNPLMLPIHHHHSNNNSGGHSSDSAISVGPFVSGPSPTTTVRRDSSAMMMVPADSSAAQQLHAVPLMIPPLTVVVGGSAPSSASAALGGSGVQQPPQMQQPPFSSLIMTEAKHFLDVPAATSRFMRPRSGSDVENIMTAQQQQQRQLQQKAAVAAALEAERQRREREEKKIRHKLKRQLATRQWLQELVIARRVKANVSRALFDSVTIEKQSHAPPIILPNGTICFSRWHLVAVFVRTTEADPKSDGLPAPNSSRWIKTGYLGSHTDTVTGMRFEPRLQCLFTSSFDGSIKRWNLRGAGSDGRATACRSDPTTEKKKHHQQRSASPPSMTML
ncbi:Hypothetical protein, putative, partial [Bodo saltans]